MRRTDSQTITALVESERGLEYEIKLYEGDPKTMLAPPSLRAVHPLGKSPVIIDGALTLAESGVAARSRAVLASECQRGGEP